MLYCWRMISPMDSYLKINLTVITSSVQALPQVIQAKELLLRISYTFGHGKLSQNLTTLFTISGMIRSMTSFLNLCWECGQAITISRSSLKIITELGYSIIERFSLNSNPSIPKFNAISTHIGAVNDGKSPMNLPFISLANY